MHARVTFAQVGPGELDETMRLLRESLYPAFKQMNGFKAALLLTNAKTEKVGGVTLWEAEADVPHVTEIAVETSGRPTRRFFEARPLEQLAMIPLIGQADREIYEVRFQVVESEAGEPRHAGVLTAQVQPGRMDEIARVTQGSVLPSKGKWEINDTYQELAAKILPLLTGPPTVERYEVSVQV